MGAVPPTLKRTLGVQPERSVSKTHPLLRERSDMDSLIQAQRGRTPECLPFHILHVYRHVDSEILESNPVLPLKSSKTWASRQVQCSPKSPVLHGNRIPRAKHSSQGGVENAC